ncbi:MAG: hypothetical protein IJ324_04070 [Lachnospiraceae bacterium]|nr:hypothetical protein [Lachnospiraceae bacterium]
MKKIFKKLLLLTMIACLCITPITSTTDSYENPYEVMPLDIPPFSKGTGH